MAKIIISDFRDYGNSDTPIWNIGLQIEQPASSYWEASSDIVGVPLWSTSVKRADSGLRVGIRATNLSKGGKKSEPFSGNHNAIIRTENSGVNLFERHIYSRQDTIQIDRTESNADGEKLSQIEVSASIKYNLLKNCQVYFRFFVEFEYPTESGTEIFESGWYGYPVDFGATQPIEPPPLDPNRWDSGGGFRQISFFITSINIEADTPIIITDKANLRVQFLLERPLNSESIDTFEVGSFLIKKMTQQEKENGNGTEGVNGVTTPPKGPGG